MEEHEYGGRHAPDTSVDSSAVDSSAVDSSGIDASGIDAGPGAGVSVAVDPAKVGEGVHTRADVVDGGHEGRRVLTVITVYTDGTSDARPAVDLER